jgi:hypothetical protein
MRCRKDVSLHSTGKVPATPIPKSMATTRLLSHISFLAFKKLKARIENRSIIIALDYIYFAW